MNSSRDVLVNSCQYAPVYLIQDPGVIQAANTYVLTMNNDQLRAPSNNLKTFYESSGNIERDVLSAAEPNPQVVLPKRDTGAIGNKLKLASFLLPKNENANKVQIISNVVLNPNVTTNHTNNSVVNTVPKLDMERKLVKIKDVPLVKRHSNKSAEKLRPKSKPKLKQPTPHHSKYTSVQLIKLGETYHSLNQLSEEQMNMVNKALNMFKDPNKTAPEPTYDPVTNTRYIYKIVSPKDLAVVGKKRIVAKDSKKNVTKCVKKVEEKIVKLPPEEPEDQEPPVQAKVTRSGRQVKLPKQMVAEGSPHKSKKKTETFVSCFQCSADFGSLYRLQKHYDNHPTHIPTKIHSNLFHCLLAIVKSGCGEDRTNMFVQQLEQLVVKLRSLLPCLLAARGDGRACTINGDVGRLFGMSPGKYNIDVEALSCVKDKTGHCVHNPPPESATGVESTGSPRAGPETDNCARIHSVAKWPTVSNRNWKRKHRTPPTSVKKIKLPYEDDVAIEPGVEEPTLDKDGDSETGTSERDGTRAAGARERDGTSAAGVCERDGTSAALHRSHVQFHSAHFDIRSSPIKSSATVFHKFQIDPSKLGKFEAQAIRSLAEPRRAAPEPLRSDCDSLHDILGGGKLDLAEESIDPEIKEWIISAGDKSRDGFPQPALLHHRGKAPLKSEMGDNAVDNSLLNFLEALGGEPHPARGADFQLDLFA